MSEERAVLAGGCFWGMQDLIRRYDGVISTRVGYTGGDVPNATYRHHGNHAEAIEIIFDPARVSYRKLLEFFFQIHDPTTRNRQGADVGPSYRSAIFYTSEQQKRIAEETIADIEASGLWPGMVVTEVKPAGAFWEAEPEHQDYLERHPGGYTCHFIRSQWKLPLREERGPAAPLCGIRACVFDAYGTLFDFTSAVGRCGAALGNRADALTVLWREKQLQYSWLRSLQGRYADFWQVTGDALDYALDALDIKSSELRDALMAAYKTLDAFPEVPSVLTGLKKRGFKTAILSNGTHEMLAAAIDRAGIGSLLDHVLSVEEVAIYKTAPQVYQLAVDRLGVRVQEISFQSSNAWDVHGASAFGMRTVWCNRKSDRRERLPGKPDREIRDLTALLDLV